MFFTIYDHQLEKLDAFEKDKFIGRAQIYLEANYPAWFKKNKAIDRVKFINEMIDFGERYGLKKERIIMELIVLEMEDSLLRFHPFPAEHENYLQTKGGDEMMKIEFLLDHISHWKKSANG